jgi:hypothetical protein
VTILRLHVSATVLASIAAADERLRCLKRSNRTLGLKRRRAEDVIIVEVLVENIQLYCEEGFVNV